MMREKALIRLAGWHARHPWRMAAFILVLTAVFAGLSTKLTVTMRWSDLLPEKDPRTVQYNQIIDEFAAATSIVIVVQGEENRIKAFADSLAPKLLVLRDTVNNDALHRTLEKMRKANASPEEITDIQRRINRPYIKRVDYKHEIGFLRDHALRLIQREDLENIREIFSDPNLPALTENINHAMEKEYTGREESLSSREKQDGAVAFLDGLVAFVQMLRRTARAEQVTGAEMDAMLDRMLLGESYMLSYDRQALILRAIPTFSVVDIDYMVRGTDAVQMLIDAMKEDFPDVKAGLTGMIPLGRDEMVYAEKSLGLTTGIAVTAILVLLIAAFRMWAAPLMAMVNLLLGIVWAVGLTAVLVGQLNIMTQMMAVILLGLGIDFSVHLISGFTEYRSSGDSIEEALRNTFVISGKGILTGGVTTSIAFLTLITASSRGMKEMGIVTGGGLLSILMAAFLILPVFLVFRERRVVRRIAKGKRNRRVRDLSFQSMGRLGQGLSRAKWTALGAALLLTGFMAWQALQVGFDQNYLNMMPEGLESVDLHDIIIEKFDLSMDYALILADSPASSRDLAADARNQKTVALVDDIGRYFPSEQEQSERADAIRSIRMELTGRPIKPDLNAGDWKNLLEQIDRLEMNVMEMQALAYTGFQINVENKCAELIGYPDRPEQVNHFEALRNEMGDPEAQIRLNRLHRRLAPKFREAVLRLSRPAVLHMDDLPESILERYSNADRTWFLVTVFPSGSMWTDFDLMRRFVSEMESVTPKVTGMPSIFHALIQVIGRDGRRALLLTVAVVFFLLWLDFGRWRHALIAMIPLISGAVWMVGLMKITGLPFTVVNVMALPMIIGIGIDDGVHIVHRWTAEGRGNLYRVFASTGKAILLTSLTTMLGFGSLVFSIYRGFGSLGGALFLGVGACFITTVLFLPPLLRLLSR